MSFRTLEISKAAELHIKEGQLEIANEEGIVCIPIEDLSQIIVHGANIRLSTMDLSILTQNRVALLTMDEKYLPTAIVLPFEGNARQSKLVHAQAKTSGDKYLGLWMQLIKSKISNQARALSIMGLIGAEEVSAYVERIRDDNVDYIEALAAKEYFAFYHDGLNRRSEDPLNSRLNYGYAVVRSYIARSLVMAGFHPAFGIHHDNQLNPFNLADDLIEPYRAIVDLTAIKNNASNIMLTKQERKELGLILHNACIVDGVKMNVMSSVDLLVESLRNIILEDSEEQLALPLIMPIERIFGITE